MPRGRVTELTPEVATAIERAERAGAEARRIAGELDALGPGFAEDGIVRFVLRHRIEQEKRRSRRSAWVQ